MPVLNVSPARIESLVRLLRPRSKVLQVLVARSVVASGSRRPERRVSPEAVTLAAPGTSCARMRRQTGWARTVRNAREGWIRVSCESENVTMSKG